MNTNLPQLSLVAFYGKKNQHPFWEMIDTMQALIGSITGDTWLPYSSERIHGTIIGLEGLNINGKVINTNYLENEKLEVEMDLASVIREVLTTSLLPCSIRVGGYHNGNGDVFTSRGKSPYQRTFIVQKENVVAMGWPYLEGQYFTSLDKLRRSFNQYGCLHKYHTPLNLFDNDFYLVLGNLKAPLGEEEEYYLREKVLAEFAQWKEVIIELRKEDISLVRFEDTRLIKAESFSLAEALLRMDELKTGYPRLAFD